MPRRRSPELRAHLQKVAEEIERHLVDPESLPDLARLRAYWRGQEVEVPERTRR